MNWNAVGEGGGGEGGEGEELERGGRKDIARDNYQGVSCIVTV